MTKLGLPTVKKHVIYLNKKNILKKEKEGQYHHYEADMENERFKIIKTAHTLINIRKAIDEIVDRIRPNTIVLFGSAAKGEDTEKSDIDIFIQAQKKSFEFDRIEKRLNRKINLIFEPEIKKINKEFLNNLANGITLYGSLKVKS